MCCFYSPWFPQGCINEIHVRPDVLRIPLNLHFSQITFSYGLWMSNISGISVYNNKHHSFITSIVSHEDFYNYRSTGAIVGIVIGALIGGAIFCTGCVLCCVCMCGNSKKATSGQVITTNQPTVSTITASQMTSNGMID